MENPAAAPPTPRQSDGAAIVSLETNSDSSKTL
jgi:hypothetical protein